MKIKIDLYGAFNSKEVRKAIEKALKEEGFEIVDNIEVVNNEDNLLIGESISTLKKGDEVIGEITTPRLLTNEEMLKILKRISKIGDSYIYQT